MKGRHDGGIGNVSPLGQKNGGTIKWHIIKAAESWFAQTASSVQKQKWL